MKTVTWNIDGMHCDGCAHTIEALVGKEPGVVKVAVSFNDRQARILYDPNAVGEDRLVAAIERGGFKVPTGSEAERDERA